MAYGEPALIDPTAPELDLRARGPQLHYILVFTYAETGERVILGAAESQNVATVEFHRHLALLGGQAVVGELMVFRQNTDEIAVLCQPISRRVV